MQITGMDICTFSILGDISIGTDRIITSPNSYVNSNEIKDREKEEEKIGKRRKKR